MDLRQQSTADRRSIDRTPSTYSRGQSASQPEPPPGRKSTPRPIKRQNSGVTTADVKFVTHHHHNTDSIPDPVNVTPASAASSLRTPTPPTTPHPYRISSQRTHLARSVHRPLRPASKVPAPHPTHISTTFRTIGYLPSLSSAHRVCSQIKKNCTPAPRSTTRPNQARAPDAKISCRSSGAACARRNRKGDFRPRLGVRELSGWSRG